MNVAVKQESFRIEAMMTSLRSECFNLCCKDLSTPELSVDEVNCVDRCAWRYLRTHKMISNALDHAKPKGKKLI